MERFAKGRLVVDPLGLGVDLRKAELDILGSERHQTLAHNVEGTLGLLP
ncbi:MAG: hypothetical protein ACREE2_20180 [Stellaceae bacterium]